MKSLVLSIVALFLIQVNGFSQAPNLEEDKKAIEKIIQSAYIDGIFNEGDAAKVKEGWHFDCDIVVYRKHKHGEMLIKNPAYVFVDMFEKGEPALHPGTTCKFKDIIIEGYAAVAIVEVFQEDKQIYTDFMNLYKLKEGWKIVTKSYYEFDK